jgi:hypothetical protein
MENREENKLKLRAGEYEPGRHGGKGYFQKFSFKNPEGTWVRSEKWVWVEAPRGYEIRNGGIVLKKDSNNFCAPTFVNLSARDD